MRVLLPDKVRQAGFQDLAPGPKQAIRRALSDLKDPAARSALDIKRLVTPSDLPPMYRLRVQDHRVAFVREGDTVRVVRIFHRSEGYAWMERPGF